MPRKPSGEFNPTKYKNEFAKENYDRLCMNIPKGYKDRLKAIADSKGKSMAQIVVDMIEKEEH